MIYDLNIFSEMKGENVFLFCPFFFLLAWRRGFTVGTIKTRRDTRHFAVNEIGI